MEIAPSGPLKTVLTSGATSVYKEVRDVGEKKALENLHKDARKWDTFTSGLSCAEQSWLDLGVLLLPQAKGVARQEIRVAFEEATIHAAEKVLVTIAQRRSAIVIACGPSAHRSYDLAENSINERQNAVMSLHQPEVKLPPHLSNQIIDQCLELLEKAEDRLRSRSR